MATSPTYDYYLIKETDPGGYTSVGATSVSGTVRTANWIEYSGAVLRIGTLTGNKFWDRAPTTPTATRTVAGTTPTATYTPSGATPTATRTPSGTAPTPTLTPTPGCLDILVNGSFEAGTLAPWVASGAVGLGPGRGPGFAAWLGGSDNAQGSLSQMLSLASVIFPLRLRFWWLAESPQPQAGDGFAVVVQHGGVYDPLRTFTASPPFGQWRFEELDLTAYAGQNVTLLFVVQTDGIMPSMFHIDDVSLTACEPATSPTPTVTSGQPPVATPTATMTPGQPPVATPTATLGPSPTPSGCQELLVDGDFEAGMLPWVGTGSVGIGPGHDSHWGAWLGGANNATGEVSQNVTIPSGSGSVTLEFWWLAEAPGDQLFDTLTVLVMTPGGPVALRTLPALGPLYSWRKETLDLKPFAGQRVGIAFRVQTDGSVPTNFRLDDVSLEVCPSGPGTRMLYLPLILRP